MKDILVWKILCQRMTRALPKKPRNQSERKETTSLMTTRGLKIILARAMRSDRCQVRSFLLLGALAFVSSYAPQRNPARASTSSHNRLERGGFGSGEDEDPEDAESGPARGLERKRSKQRHEKSPEVSSS